MRRLVGISLGFVFILAVAWWTWPSTAPASPGCVGPSSGGATTPYLDLCKIPRTINPQDFVDNYGQSLTALDQLFAPTIPLLGHRHDGTNGHGPKLPPTSLDSVNAPQDRLCLVYHQATNQAEWLSCGAGGTLTGAPSSTDEALVRWNGTTGQVLDNSTVTLSDDGRMTFPDDGGVDLRNVLLDGPGEGLLLPAQTDCTTVIDNGQVCWDDDDKTLCIGTTTESRCLATDLDLDQVKKVVLAGGANTTITGNQILYLPFNGSDVWATQAPAATPTDQRTYRNLRCSVDQAPGVGESVTLRVQVGTCGTPLVNTALLCTISNTATTATDLGNSLLAAAGNCLVMRVQTSAGAANVVPRFFIEAS